MTPEEICAAVVRHELTPEVAINQLISEHQYEPAVAKETIFIALGGDDVVGTDRYHQSGKPVEEVDRQFEE